MRAPDPPESGKFFFANRDTGQPGRVVEVKIVSLISEQHILNASPDPEVSVDGLTLYHDGGVF